MKKTIYLVLPEDYPLEDIVDSVLHPYNGFPHQCPDLDTAQKKLQELSKENEKYVIRAVTALVE